MKTRVAAALAALVLMLALPRAASALVLDVAPSTVRVGQEVTFTIWAPFFLTTNCGLIINYGDGGGYQPAGHCFSTACTKTVKHIYSLPGVYTATARTAPTASCAASSPKPPPTFSRKVKVIAPLMTLRATPSPIRVPQARTTVQRVTYRATSPAMVAMLLKSTNGVFTAAGRVLGTVNTPLTITMTGGNGTASEQVTIPAGILSQARSLGATSITYGRSFMLGNAGVGTASVIIRPTSPLAADFRITAVHLYFDNLRPEITVRRNQPNLVVNARLNYVGTGLLRARWRIDGRPGALVTRHLVSAKGTVVLTSPRINALPTFMTGSHRVSLEILKPEPGIRIPVATYFVTAAEYQPAKPITLTAPAPRAKLTAGQVELQWQPLAGPGFYLVEFLSGPKGERLLAALTRKPRYRLPADLWRQYLAGAKRLYWRVSKLDQDGQVIGASPTRPVRPVPGLP